MSSILTNNGAMVALQTLKGINKNMAATQNEISTGKSVATAKDNAAVWAISKVMESDVKGFEAISDNLALGESTVAVARNAGESITDLLKEIKGKIVDSQEDNKDRGKIQTDIKALSDQIKSVVDSAQFNGLNLLKSAGESENNPVNVLSSLDRASDGSVTTSHIAVARQDLTQTQQSVDTTAGTFAAGTATTLDNTAQTASISVAAPTAGVAYSLSIAGTNGGGGLDETAYDAGGALAGSDTIAYVAADGDTAADVAKGLSDAYNTWATAQGLDTTATGLRISANGSDLQLESSATATDTFAVSVDTVTSNDNVAAGGLAALANIDVSTNQGAADALSAIEGLIQTSIDSAAAFGSTEKRIEIQAEFVGKLTNSLKSGIGSMVDANMEEVSARLQALQVQQQLGTQSLSMANQAPQSLLSLFR